jgi:hypothetical protein
MGFRASSSLQEAIDFRRRELTIRERIYDAESLREITENYLNEENVRKRTLEEHLNLMLFLNRNSVYVGQVI